MYTIAENDLNYLEKSAFDDDEIHQEHDKANKDTEVEVGEVTKGITLGHKDKRQVKKQKKL